MAKSLEKIKARELRRRGMSIKKIARKLNVSVSSVSYWCRDIILTSEQIEALSKRVTDPFYGRKLAYFNKQKKDFEKKLARLRKEGIKTVGRLSEREIFLIGVALYWGEGFRKDHQVGFATSNSDMAKFFVHWLKASFNIQPKDLILRVTANIEYQKLVNKLEGYWAKELAISKNQFSKPFFQKTKWKKEYENKEDYHGVLRIKVRKSTDLLRKIHAYIEGFILNLS